jgi:hypothetical protein
MANLHPSTILNYSPKVAIITNVDFLRNTSQSNVWSTAPAFAPPVNFRPAAASRPKQIPPSSSAPRNDFMSSGTASVGANSNRTSLSKFNYAAKRNASNNDQATATTFASDAQAARFSATEAKIQTHQNAIAHHQSTFKSVHERFDSVEDKALHTIEVCQASSKSILELHQESFKQMSVLREESATSIRVLREEATLFQTYLQGQLTFLGDLIRNLSSNNPPQASSSSSTSSSRSSDSRMLSYHLLPPP